MVIGQVNVGKSALINALKNDVVAEVDHLPTTEHLTCYPFSMTEQQACHLIDLPGLNEMIEADLILWLVKANQPHFRLEAIQATMLEKMAESKHVQRNRQRYHADPHASI